MDHGDVLRLDLNWILGQEVACQGLEVKIQTVQITKCFEDSEVVIRRRVQLCQGGAVSCILEAEILCATWTEADVSTRQGEAGSRYTSNYSNILLLLDLNSCVVVLIPTTVARGGCSLERTCAVA